MDYLIYFLIGFIIAMAIAIFVVYRKLKQIENLGGIIGESQQKHEQNIKKLKNHLESLPVDTKITNNDVEKKLGVSDATAERYLNKLEQEGVLKQFGEKGGFVYYQKIR